MLVAPGNAGTALEPKTENIAVAADDIDGLLALAQSRGIELTVVGPEAPLVAGIKDRFQAAGLRCFGPSRAAARLEGSKAFCKEFLTRHAIPTAAYQSFTDLQPALDYLRERGAPQVIKADGLAAGKGVVVAHTLAEAEAALTAMLGERSFGAAGQRVVIEDFLAGEEASFIAMAAGESCLPLASSQDHKARDDGDSGPNTGGMGAYSPAPVITPQLHERIMSDIIRPTLRGLAADGCPYSGFLYAGLMIDGDVPRVLEYNCRLGDPETQPIMLRLRSDLVELCLATLDGRLAQCRADWDRRPALGVVLAAGGYPGDYRRGDVITGLTAAGDENDHKLFHAGTRSDNGDIVTDGGRVLCATALGDDIAAAQLNAYTLAGRVRWENIFYRRDIGHRALNR